MTEVSLKEAISIANDYFSDLYHEKEYAKAIGLPNLNWVGFNVIDADESEGIYVIKCEVKENYFSANKRKYTIRISKEGAIIGVKRDDDSGMA